MVIKTGMTGDYDWTKTINLHEDLPSGVGKAIESLAYEISRRSDYKAVGFLELDGHEVFKSEPFTEMDSYELCKEMKEAVWNICGIRAEA